MLLWRHTHSSDCAASKLAELLRDANVSDLAPLQERYVELRAKPKLVTDALAQGGEQARAIAQKTMAEVHRAMGLTSASQRASS